MNAAQPVSFRLTSQQQRRQIVLFYAGGLLTVLVLQIFRLGGRFDHLSPNARLPMIILYLFGFGLTLYGVWKLSFPARLGLPQGHTHQMDERQVLRVAQATTTAYRGVSFVLLMIAAAFVWWGGDLSALTSRSDGITGLMFVALFLLPHLPTAVLAWTEPDPLEE